RGSGRSYASDGGGRDAGSWRGGGSVWRSQGSRMPGMREWRGSGSGDSRSSGSGWRSSGSREWARARSYGGPLYRGSYRSGSGWRDGGGRAYVPQYRSRVYYRDGGRSYYSYRPRTYYYGSFHRPRFIHRSGFSLGFVIGADPSYGYRYYDPSSGG